MYIVFIIQLWTPHACQDSGEAYFFVQRPRCECGRAMRGHYKTSINGNDQLMRMDCLTYKTSHWFYFYRKTSSNAGLNCSSFWTLKVWFQFYLSCCITAGCGQMSHTTPTSAVIICTVRALFNQQRWEHQSFAFMWDVVWSRSLISGGSGNIWSCPWLSNWSVV